MKKLTYLLFCLITGIGLVSAQTVQVSGTVISAEDGEPLIGASVIAKGTSSGMMTDADGKFTFSIPSSVTTLVVRYIGFKEAEVAAGTNIRVVLDPDTQVLSEVVVTAMGILRPARSIGYGQSVVDPDQAIQKAEPDMFRALQGKMPGVQITSTMSTPGSATKIQIRGVSSFYGGNEPLYIVDGVPYSNPEYSTGSRLTSSSSYMTGISTLDPNDIESIDILKGAAAAALYGGRASNGVILITTKSGSKKTRPSQKKFEVTFSSSYSTEKIASLPEYQNTFGQGSNFLYSNANGSWGPAFGGELKEVPTWANYLDAYPDMPAMQPYQAYPNNVSGLFNTGAIWDNSVNVSSQNDKGVFNTTVSLLSQDGIVPYSTFKRTAFSVGGNQKLDNGLTVGGTLSFSRGDQNGPTFGAGNYGGSISSFARTMLMPRNIDAVGLPYETPDHASLFPFSATTVDNPLWSWKYNPVTTLMDRIITTVNAGYDITPWLSAYYQFGWNQLSTSLKQVVNLGSTGPSGLIGEGQITNAQYKTDEMESNFNLTFKHKFLEDALDLRVVAGHNVNQSVYVRNSATGSRMIYPDIFNVDNTQAQTAGEYHSKSRLWALYADVQLGYKNYAFLGFSIRNDHSSTLPVENNSYVYPSVSGSFIFSDFFQIDPSILNYGKVRAAWGKTGRDAGVYYVNGSFIDDTPFSGRPLMSTPTTTYDPELKPEFSTEFDAGTELMFFNNRIGIDFTWYSKLSTNQIAPVSLPASTGSSTYYTNFGEMTNKGVELSLTLVPIDLKDSFKWNILTVFTKNKNEIKSLTFNGMDQEQLTLSTGSTSEAQPTLKPGFPYGFLRGSVIARDTDGTPLVNPATGAYMVATDLGDLGSPHPDYVYSITNTFSYKGLYLSAMLNARIGGVTVAGSPSDMMGRGVTRDTEDRYGTRILWGVYGNPNTLEPILDASGNRIQNIVQLSENDLWFAAASTQPTFAMNSVQEFSVYDATVIRLSEISLGYDVPRKYLQKTFIGSATASIIARNLWYYAPGFPKYTHYDPGSNTFGTGNVQGIEKEVAPTTRRIAFNLKLTF